MNKFLEKQIDYILNRLEKAGANKDTEWTVNLSVYDDDALRVLRPDEKWDGGADEHRKMMGYVSAVVRNKYPKISVNLIEIKLVEYQLYLKANGLDDTPGERSKYITLKTNGKC